MMIKSMTGYGKAAAELQNGKLTVEIRSINGKNADINVKTYLIPKDKEMEVRKRLAETLQRGTIDLFLTWEPNAAESAGKIDIPLAQEYYRQICSLGQSIGISNLTEQDPNYLMATILRMPDVIDSGKKDIITEDNWPSVLNAIDEAVGNLCAYRETEGEALYKDVTSRIGTILDIYDEIENYETERIASARERILKAAEDINVSLNRERLEQEMIFYLEKLDINEEKVRLRQHCKYFLDTIDGEPFPGKKLGFIIQEMGREINTTGSKANHAGMQKCVVRMKDELEKIREQSMNIL